MVQMEGLSTRIVQYPAAKGLEKAEEGGVHRGLGKEGPSWLYVGGESRRVGRKVERSRGKKKSFKAPFS